VSKKAVDRPSFNIAKMADLGDIVVCAGPVGSTKTGEITVWATGDGAFSIATKSLAPPPGKWHGLQDAEQRYRKRYVDLYANPEVMATMRLRIRIVDEIRRYLQDRGYLEVETPMLQSIHGGAAARPFTTHHNALDMPLYLRIAPELYLKRLLVGGFNKVFEINRNFRNEGISPRHNPEFTMLEAYEAFGSWETMADMVEDMICTVAQNVLGTLKIEHKDADGNVTKTINLERPWRRVSMVDLVKERTGWQFQQENLDLTSPESQTILNELQQRMFPPQTRDTPALTPEYINLTSPFGRYWSHFIELTAAEQLVEVYEKLIEPTLIDPTFVTHVPSVTIPLARANKDDPFFADVYELAINGQEISPGYTELNDPQVQKQHLSSQVGDREEQQQMDEDFINALEVGMPPAGGMGLGVDRLVMMLTGAESIRDIILFPLMRPR
jgi:lysyl-tRNA synthetase class 2